MCFVFLPCSHVGFVFQLWHKCFSGNCFYRNFQVELMLFLNFFFCKWVQLRSSKNESYFQVLKLLSRVGKFVSINVGCLRVFSYPKIGPKVLSFSCIFRLGKIGRGTRQDENYCIHSCHHVQLKSPSSCIEFMSCKEIFRKKIMPFLKFGSLDLFSLKCACLTSTVNGQLGVCRPFGVVSFKVLQLRCRMLIWYGLPPNLGL